MDTLTQKSQEIAILKTALRNAYDDLKRSKHIIDSLKFALHISEMALKANDRTMREQDERIIDLEMRNRN